jgi:hypothetical protein
MSYLFWSQIIFWIVLLIYVYYLIRKNHALKNQLESIESSLNSNEENQ